MYYIRHLLCIIKKKSQFAVSYSIFTSMKYCVYGFGLPGCLEIKPQSKYTLKAKEETALNRVIFVVYCVYSIITLVSKSEFQSIRL